MDAEAKGSVALHRRSTWRRIQRSFRGGESKTHLFFITNSSSFNFGILALVLEWAAAGPEIAVDLTQGLVS